MSPVLVNGDGVAAFYFCRETDDIPISEANAAMTRGVANRIGILGAVDANSFFIECDPHYADRIVRTGREKMEIAAALAVFEHFFVIPKSWHLGDTAHLPLANRRRGLRGTDGDWICSNELISFKNAQHAGLGIDLHGDSHRGGLADVGFLIRVCISTLLRIGLLFDVICSLWHGFASRFDIFHRTEFKRFDVRDDELIAHLDRLCLAGIELLKEMNVAMKLLCDGFGGIAIRKKCYLGFC